MPSPGELDLGDPVRPTAIPTSERPVSTGLPPVIGDPGSQEQLESLLLSDSDGRADTNLDGGRIGILDVRAASVRGRSHRFGLNAVRGRARQDEYCLSASTDGRWLVAAVADGVSQSDKSHVAATIAARRGCQLVVDALNNSVQPNALAWTEEIAPRISGYIVHEAAKMQLVELGVEDKDDATLARDVADSMATTAIFAIVDTVPSDAGEVAFVVAVLAGDSAAWKLAAREWRPLTGVKNADTEIASMAVRPLPLASKCLVIDGTLQSGEALILMTDGLGDPLGSGQGDVGAFFATQWQTPPDAHVFAAQLDFFRRSFDDDRTAVAIWLADTPRDE